MFNYYPRQKVFCFQKSPHEEVQFSVGERNGNLFADIRIFHVQEDGSRVWTQKGIYLFREKLPALKEGLERLLEAVQAKA